MTRISGEDHWSYGKKLSESTRQLMSEKKKGENNPRYKGRYVTPAGIFMNSIEAAKANGVSRATVVNRCNRSTDGKPGSHAHCIGWYYENKFDPSLSWHNPPVFEPAPPREKVVKDGQDVYSPVSYSRSIKR